MARTHQNNHQPRENGYSRNHVEENGHSSKGSPEHSSPSPSDGRSVTSQSIEDHFTRSLSSGPTLRSRGGFQPQIDKAYSIVQKDGTTATGDVLAIRQNSRTKVMEYFVHYEGQNRRLDEWIGIDRFKEDPILPAAVPAPAKLKYEGRSLMAVTPVVADPLSKGTQKVTRSARRKFDEMNHIQPSLAELLPSQVRIL